MNSLQFTIPFGFYGIEDVKKIQIYRSNSLVGWSKTHCLLYRQHFVAHRQHVFGCLSFGHSHTVPI